MLEVMHSITIITVLSCAELCWALLKKEIWRPTIRIRRFVANQYLTMQSIENRSEGGRAFNSYISAFAASIAAHRATRKNGNYDEYERLVLHRLLLPFRAQINYINVFFFFCMLFVPLLIRFARNQTDGQRWWLQLYRYKVIYSYIHCPAT